MLCPNDMNQTLIIPIFLQVADWEVLDGEALMSM